MLRKLSLSLAGIGSIVLAAAAASLTGASPVSLHTQTPAEQKILAQLDQQTTVEFLDTPLRDAMTFIGDLHGLPIIIEKTALEEAGIATDEPINRQLSGIKLRSALNIMLEPLGLTYLIEDEVLKITTAASAAERLETRVYTIRSLEKAGIDSQTLAKTVRQTIRPESWAAEELEPQPGNVFMGFPGAAAAERPSPPKRTGRGTIAALPGALVVLQSQRIHDEVAELLSQLARLEQVRGE